MIIQNNGLQNTRKKAVKKLASGSIRVNKGKYSVMTFSIILTQGMNRQIRYMCRHFDYHVRRLKRIRIMNITLGDLQTGKWRYVTPEELAKMREMFGKDVCR